MDARFLIAPALFVCGIIGNYLLYPANVMKLCHLFGASLNFGMSAYTTCIVGAVMLKTLPRPQFAAVQKKLFPIYFSLQTICSIGIAYVMSTYKHNVGYQKQIVYVTALLALLELLLIEPQATKALDVYLKLTKEQGEESQSKEFKKTKGKFFAWHGVSTLINIVSFVLQTFHVYWLASKLSIQ
eukprot:UN00492